MKRFAQVVIPCLLVALVAFVTVRIGAAGTAKASSSCGSWTIIHSPNPPQTNNSGFYSVAAISRNDVWAVGSYFVNRFDTNTLIEHWNGTSWSIVPSPSPGSNTIEDQLFAVAAISSNNVWAAGVQNNLPLIEHWNGQQWNVVSSPMPFSSGSLFGIAAISSNDIWVVGNYNASTLTEHWNGQKWSIVSSPNEGSLDSEFHSVTAVSSSDVWAVGDYLNSNAIEQTLTEHWDGTKWSIVASPNTGTQDNALNGVSAVSSSNIWAVGSYIVRTQSSFYFQTLIEHWNGTKWHVVSSPHPGTPDDSLNSVAVVSAKNVWAVGSYTTQGTLPLIVHWDGTTWQAVSNPSLAPTSLLLGVTVVPGTSRLWAVGSTTSAIHPHVVKTLTEFYC